MAVLLNYFAEKKQLTQPKGDVFHLQISKNITA